MIVKIKYKKQWYDISDFIDPFDNWFEKTISGNQSSGKISIPAIKVGEISWLDVSKRFPSYCEVEIDNERGTKYGYFTGDCYCSEVVADKVYSHDINLIDYKKMLEMKTLVDCTITQPKSGEGYRGSAPRIVYKLSSNNLWSEIYKKTHDKYEFQSGQFLTDYGISATAGSPNEGTPFYIGDMSGYDDLKERELDLEVVEENNTLGVFNGTNILKKGEYSVVINVKGLNPSFSKLLSRATGDKGGAGVNGNPLFDIGYQLGSGNRTYLGATDISPQDNVNLTFGVYPTSAFNDVYYLEGNIGMKVHEFKKSTLIRIDNPTTFKLFGKNRKEYVNDEWWLSSLIIKRLLFPDTVVSLKQLPIYYINDIEVTITQVSKTLEEDENLGIRLSDVLLKVLRLSDLDIKVSSTTLTQLSQYGSPEFTWSKYTVLQALEEIGGVCGAKPELIKQDDGDFEIIFNEYSALENFEIIEPPNVSDISNGRDFENYVSSLELNADNVVDSKKTQYAPYNPHFLDNYFNDPIKTDWLSLRADRDETTKITDVTLGLKLPYKIDYIKDIEVTGVDLSSASSLLPYGADVVWHLKSTDDDDVLRIVEESYYMTQSDMNDYTTTNRRLTSKNNLIYYTQGQDRIKGICFTPDQEPNFVANHQNRSLVEILFLKAIKLQNITNTSQLSSIMDKSALLNNAKIRVTYVPQFSTRTTVWKEDLSGFERKNITKYYNETATVNDVVTLGDISQNALNRLGNTQYVVIGHATTEKLPTIGSKTADNHILTSIKTVETPDRTYYTAVYVKDFTIIRDYVGIKSPYRQYEIPPNATVYRMDKRKTHILLYTSTPKFNTTLYTPSAWGTFMLQYFFMYRPVYGSVIAEPVAPLFVFNTIYTQKRDTVSYILPNNNTCTLKINNLYGVVDSVSFWKIPQPMIDLYPELEGKIGATIYKNAVGSFAYLDETLSAVDFQYFTNAKEFFDYVKLGNDVDMIFNNDITWDKMVQVPLLTSTAGTTISFTWNMQNNYSVGSKRVSVDGIEIQQDVPYTDTYGRVARIKSNLVKDINKEFPPSNEIVLLNNYPEIHPAVVAESYAMFDYISDKDAREIMGGNYEVSFHSNDVDEIILYSGWAKYNPMALTNTDDVDVRIGVLKDDYKISKSDTRIDVSKLQSVGGELISNISSDLFNKRIGYIVYDDGALDKYFSFTVPQTAKGRGIVMYENNTKELIMILNQPVDGSKEHKVYFTEINLNE